MTKLDRIREFMNRNFDTAQELFVAFKSECSEHQTILCPVQWLYNQNTMRDMWERFRMKPLAMLDNSFSKYMKFMYYSYPPGFGDASRYQKKNEVVDFAAVYRSLSRRCRTCSDCEPVNTKYLVCSRCRIARYCSTDCQRENWRDHKEYCKDYWKESKYRTLRVCRPCF